MSNVRTRCTEIRVMSGLAVRYESCVGLQFRYESRQSSRYLDMSRVMSGLAVPRACVMSGLAVPIYESYLGLQVRYE